MPTLISITAYLRQSNSPAVESIGMLLFLRAGKEQKSGDFFQWFLGSFFERSDG